MKPFNFDYTPYPHVHRYDREYGTLVIDLWVLNNVDKDDFVWEFHESKPALGVRFRHEADSIAFTLRFSL